MVCEMMTRKGVKLTQFNSNFQYEREMKSRWYLAKITKIIQSKGTIIEPRNWSWRLMKRGNDSSFRWWSEIARRRELANNDAAIFSGGMRRYCGTAVVPTEAWGGKNKAIYESNNYVNEGMMMKCCFCGVKWRHWLQARERRSPWERKYIGSEANMCVPSTISIQYASKRSGSCAKLAKALLHSSISAWNFEHR